MAIARRPEEDSILTDVISSVMKACAGNGSLEKLEWDVVEDANTESLTFRAKDKSALPYRGFAVCVAIDDLKFFQGDEMIKAVSAAFQRRLNSAEGLPIKKTGQPYSTEVIRSY